MFNHRKKANDRKRYSLIREKAKRDQMTEEWIDEKIQKKLEVLLADKYPNCLLIYDCVPAFIEYLKMVRDNNYTVDLNTNYYKMIGFILQELDLIYVNRTYLSNLDNITEEGLEIFDIGM